MKLNGSVSETVVLLSGIKITMTVVLAICKCIQYTPINIFSKTKYYIIQDVHIPKQSREWKCIINVPFRN